MIRRMDSVRYAKRCEACHDWCLAGKPALYDAETKRMWHDNGSCPPLPKELKGEETPEQIAARLNFHPCD